MSREGPRGWKQYTKAVAQQQRALYARPFNGYMDPVYKRSRGNYPDMRYRAPPRGYTRARAQRYGRLRRQKAAPYRRSYRRNTATMGFLGIEKKFYDTNLNARAILAPTDSSGGEADPSAASMISTPVRGDSEQNRDGKQINILNVSIKGTVSILFKELQTGPVQSNEVYVCLVQDTQTNGAQLNSEDVFKNTGATAIMASNPQKNLLFMNRFRLLKSQKFDMTPTTLSHFADDSFSWHGKIRHFDWFLPLNMKVNFNAGTTADVANVIDNSLHIITFCTNTGAAPVLSYNARIRFVG